MEISSSGIRIVSWAKALTHPGRGHSVRHIGLLAGAPRDCGGGGRGLPCAVKKQNHHRRAGCAELGQRRSDDLEWPPPFAPSGVCVPHPADRCGSTRLGTAAFCRSGLPHIAPGKPVHSAFIESFMYGRPPRCKVQSDVVASLGLGAFMYAACVCGPCS